MIADEAYREEVVTSFLVAAIALDFDPGQGPEGEDPDELGTGESEAEEMVASVWPACRAAVRAYVDEFIGKEGVAAALEVAAHRNRASYRANYTDAALAGHDLYCTAVGHGCGFWDRDYGAAGDFLTAAVVDLCGIGGPWADPDGDVYFDLPTRYGDSRA